MSTRNRQIAKSFIHGRPFASSNVTVCRRDGRLQLLSHGRCIAVKEGATVLISVAGHPSKVTLARLNAVGVHLGFRLVALGGLLYLTTKHTTTVIDSTTWYAIEGVN